MVFATHEVTLYGNSLRRIEMALQRMELSFIGKLPGDYRATLADGQPLVREIAVVPLEQNRNDGLEAAIGEDGPSDTHRS